MKNKNQLKREVNLTKTLSNWLSTIFLSPNLLVILLITTFFVCHLEDAVGQTPGVVLKTNHFGTDQELIDATHDNEEWIFSTIEDKNGDIVNGGFVEPKEIISGKWQATHKWPALIKLDEDLNEKQHTIYKEVYGLSTSATYTIEEKISSIVDVSELPGKGYVGAGFAIVKYAGVNRTKAIYYPCDYEFSSTTNKPFVLEETDATSTRFYAIRGYKNTTLNRYEYFAAGHKYKNGKPQLWIAKLDINGTILAQTFVEDVSSMEFNGELRGINLVYPSGCLPSGQPKDASEQPTHLLVSGTTYEYSGSTIIDKDAIVAAFDLSLSTQHDYDLFDSDPGSTAPNTTIYPAAGFFDYTDFPKGYWVCQAYTDPDHASFVGRRFDDVGNNIEQNLTGDAFVFSSLSHHILKNKVDLTLCGEGDRSQLISGDHINHILTWDASNKKIVVEDYLHTSHLSGDDFFWRSKFNYDNKIYTLATTGDWDKALKRESPNNTDDYHDNFMLVACTYNTGTYALSNDWHKVFLGGSGPRSDQLASTCGFDCAITCNNEIVASGNNGMERENWDFAIISDDCIPNDPLLPIPDIVANQGTYTYSLATAMGNVPGVRTWGSSKIVKAQVVIESGYTLRIPIHQYNRIQFYDVRYLEDNQQANNAYQSDAGVIIMPGGRLELLNGAELTALDNTSCFSTWGGVDVGTQIVYGAYPAELEMENSTISNATVGVSVYDGYIDAYNNSQQSPSAVGLYADIIGDQFTPPNPIGNFVNNNISIFHNSAQTSWSVTPGYTERYSLLKFLCEDKTSYTKGLDYFVKYQGHQNNSYYNNLYSHLKFEGCEFKNTYFTNLGMCAGISSFGGSLDVMFGVLDPAAITEGCKPNLTRNSKFIGLYSGIKNGYTNHGRSTRFRVAEAEFDNNREAIIDGVGKNSLIYKNNIHWDDYVYPFNGINDTKLGVYNSWGWGTEILENEIYNTLDQNFLAIYTSQNAWHSSYGGENVRLNRIENASIAPYLGTGHKISSDNTEMQITCNTYIGLYNDWFVTGPLANQGTVSLHNKNDWSSWGGNPFSDIDGTVTTSFIYRSPDPNGPPNIYAAQFTNSPLVAEVIGPFPSSGITCPVLDPCLVYDKDETEWDIIASQPQQTDPIDDVLDDLFSGRTDEVKVALNSLEFEGVYNKMDNLIATLMPASSEKRLYRLNGKEIAKLKSLATESSFTGQLAADVLFHFADTRTALDTYTGERKVINEQYVETAANKEINKLAQVRLFPNPASKNLTIVTSENEDYTAQVLDLNGKAIFTFEGQSNTQVDISSLAKGMYFIQIKTEDGQTAHKLIVD